MSASREKQNRRERVSSGWMDPKTAREAQQRKQEKRTSVLYGVIAAVFLVVAATAIIYRSNIIPKSTTAVTIDGEKYTAGEVEFYLQNAYRGFLNNENISYLTGYLGLDTSAPLNAQVISGDAATIMAAMGYEGAEADQTWYDFFLNLALDQMATVQVGLKAAQAEGFAWPESGVQARYDDSMASLKSAAQVSGISVNAYLANSFSPLMTEKIYSTQMMRLLRFSAYSEARQEGLTYSDAELEEAYAASPDSYDRVAYESVSFSGAAPGTTDEDGNTVEPTEEESAAAMAMAEETANSLLTDFDENGGSLEALAEAYGGVYSNQAGAAYYSDSDLMEWLYDSERQDGDASIIESGTTYYVVFFHDRFREEYETIDVRHILVRPESGLLGSEDDGYEAEQAQLKAAAKARADELLARWLSGEATEDSFAALAMQESSDGSRYNGGLYARVTQGQMVAAFNDWCFDPARQAGDTGVVETQYGYHVMYFSGRDLPAWKAAVRATLVGEDYAEWEMGLAAGSTITRNEAGMKYVG